MISATYGQVGSATAISVAASEADADQISGERIKAGGLGVEGEAAGTAQGINVAWQFSEGERAVVRSVLQDTRLSERNVRG